MFFIILLKDGQGAFTPDTNRLLTVGYLTPKVSGLYLYWTNFLQDFRRKQKYYIYANLYAEAFIFY